jgi:hypothetical protein
MSRHRLFLTLALASPLALAGLPAMAQAYEDATPPSLSVTLGSDSDQLAISDADINHRIDLRADDGDLTAQEADTARDDLDDIRADAAQIVSDNGRLTGADRASLEDRLSDLSGEVDDLASNPDRDN